MHEVEELFAGRNCKTKVRLSGTARDGMGEFQKRHEEHRGSFLKKLQRYASAGFGCGLYEGEGKPIRLEWDGVYRISDGGLFRLIGFYEDDVTKKDFIVIDTLLKRGKKLSSSERNKIDEVVAVKRDALWRKKVENGEYPRLAQDT